MSKTASGQLFADYLAGVRPRIEHYLSETTPQPAPEESTAADMERYLYAPFAHFSATGGKRTRPALALLGAEAVGGDPELALSSAAAIEDFQSAALIHDDIADEGQLRRGEPCTYLTEGIGVATNIGDLGIVRTFARIIDDPALIEPTKLTLLELLGAMEQRTVEGQALDLGWARDGRWDMSTADYLSMAAHKTAYYSAAIPLAMGAVAGGGTPAERAALESFGMDAGLAFQLQDDLLNIVGDPTAQGKDFRTDITEGKRTMLVTWSLEHLSPRLRDELIALLSAHTTDEGKLARAVEIMEDAGAIEAVERYAAERVASAKDALQNTTLRSHAQAVLASAADFFVERVG